MTGTGRKEWVEVEVRVAGAAVGGVEAALEGLGALAVSLADPGGEPVLEPAPGEMPLWGEVVVTALFPRDADVARIRATLAQAAGVAPRDIAASGLVERDWVREFRENLAPLRFGDRLWICPEGTPCPDPAGIALTLEPGLAFGSGAHPTTAMCLTWLAGLDLRGRRVLDWGCGSGVLALAALALGARGATGVDIDPQALLATRDNAARNGLASGLAVCGIDGVAADARFDVVVANILAGSLIELAPTLAAHCAAGAPVALSGILASQADQVRDACAPWLALHTAAEHNGWALLAGTPAPRPS